MSAERLFLEISVEIRPCCKKQELDFLLFLGRCGAPLVGLGQTFGDDAPKFSFEILIILTQISRKF